MNCHFTQNDGFAFVQNDKTGNNRNFYGKISGTRVPVLKEII